MKQAVGDLVLSSAGIFIIGLSLSCAHRPPTPPTARASPRVLVCDIGNREEIRHALIRGVVNATYAWDFVRCRRAQLAADHLSSSCAAGDMQCALPEYINGIPLADDSATEDFVFVLNRLTQETRIERAWRPGFTHRGGKPSHTDMEPYDREVQTDGLSGPAYLIASRSGRLVGALQLQSATPRDVAEALLRLIEAQAAAGKAPH